MAVRVTPVCASRFSGRPPADGFSLLEVMVSILISMLVVTISGQFFVSLWRGTYQVQNLRDRAAAMDNIARVLEFDGHQALSIQQSLGHLVIHSVSGVRYTYLTNGQNQFVRIQSGGGTTVIASGTVAASCIVASNRFQETLLFMDGSREEVHVCTLNGLT